MRNVTIRQILKENASSEETYRVDNVELTTVGACMVAVQSCMHAWQCAACTAPSHCLPFPLKAHVRDTDAIHYAMQAHPHAHPSPLPLPQFFLVGRILTRTDTAAALKLKVDDGTGTLEVVHYLEDGGNELVSRAGGYSLWRGGSTGGQGAVAHACTPLVL